MESVQFLEPSIRLVEPFHQLAPYMSNLSEADFSQANFAKFADRLLGDSSSSSSSSSASSFSSSSSSASWEEPALSPSWSQSQSPASSWQACIEGAQVSAPKSSWPNSPYTVSSQAASPHVAPSAALEPQYCDFIPENSSYSHSSFSSGSSYSSCSYPTSGASSPGSDGDNWPMNSPLEQHLDPSGAKFNGQTSGGKVVGFSRKRRNASAAERYRRKLKGRRTGLELEMEQQAERNKSLRRQIGAKLALYGEFVALLAEKSGPKNCSLASIGERSLASVLETVAGQKDGVELQLELDRSAEQLAAHLAHFRQIISACR